MRWRPVLGLGRKEKFKLVGMLDLANGRWAPQAASDPVVQEIFDRGQPPIPTGLRIVDPRELYLEWTLRYGQLRLGQMSFTWGQGLLANDGNNMDRFGDMKFGNDGDGSIQERILFGTKPLARRGGPGKDVIFALGADLIFRDPNANLVEGDLAGQGFLVVRWEPRRQARAPTWVATSRLPTPDEVRTMATSVEDDDHVARCGVVDLAGQRIPLSSNPKLAIMGAFEGVAIGGRTSFQSVRDDSVSPASSKEARPPCGASSATRRAGSRVFDAGWFSGDNNPDDDQQSTPSTPRPATPQASCSCSPTSEGWQSARSAEAGSPIPSSRASLPTGRSIMPSRGKRRRTSCSSSPRHDTA